MLPNFLFSSYLRPFYVTGQAKKKWYQRNLEKSVFSIRVINEIVLIHLPAFTLNADKMLGKINETVL